jgi:hypothetical protein
MSNSKPPIGVEPAWLCASRRISELAKAIARYADDEHGVERRFLIRLWADEIKMQLDIWDKNTVLEEMVYEEHES